MITLPTKNTSPGQLSFYTALALAVIITIASLFLRLSWYVPVFIFCFTFLAAYFIYYYTLKYFLYRKIKLIYKFINKAKATNREIFFRDNILPQKSIEEVSYDVLEWTKEKKLELEVLQENEKFRKEFLMNLAHELKTPIFTIQGYLDTLLDGAIEDPAVSRKFLSNASKGIERLAQLAEDLDEITKLESGEIRVDKENFVIQNLVKDVYAEMTLKAEEKKIELRIKKGTENPLKVFADKKKIRQVIVNLVDNALKYGKENGEIVTGFYEMDEKQIYIEISDDGIGIGDEHMSRLFERFYRVDRSRERQIGGTGLGLAIVKHIVEAHEQTINVRSKIGVGSSFGFTLQKSKV